MNGKAIEIVGLDDVYKAFDRTVIEVPKDVVVDVTDDIFEKTLVNVAPHRRTGWLERNIYKDVKKTSVGYEGSVYIQNVPYAPFVHFGWKHYKGDPFLWNATKSVVDKLF